MLEFRRKCNNNWGTLLQAIEQRLDFILSDRGNSEEFDPNGKLDWLKLQSFFSVWGSYAYAVCSEQEEKILKDFEYLDSDITERTNVQLKR